MKQLTRGSSAEKMVGMESAGVSEFATRFL
jgi:hypothetical protein